MGCNTFSAGETKYTECLMPRAYPDMLDFLRLANEVPGYTEPFKNDEADIEVGGVGGVGGVQDRAVVEWIKGDEENLRPQITFSMHDDAGRVKEIA